MHKKLLGLALAGALFVPSVSSAAILTWGGALSLQLGTLPGIVVPGNGPGGTGLAGVNGSGPTGHLTQLALGAGTFGPVSASVPVTTNATVNSIRFSGVQNASGLFVGGSTASNLTGLMGLSGLAKICLTFDGTCVYVNVTVPLTGGIGSGPSTQLFPGAVSITLQHSGWGEGASTTIHSATTTITTAAVPGFVHDASTGTSNTAAGSGTVQLVTVTKAFTSLTGAFPELPLFAVMQLHFVPEPGTLLLLGAGVAGLAAFGRKKMRK